MAPVIGKAAPSFAGTAVMPDGSFKELALGDFAGKWVVLYFYPLDFTFVCPTEICAFSDRAGEFEKLNTQLVGVRALVCERQIFGKKIILSATLAGFCETTPSSNC